MAGLLNQVTTGYFCCGIVIDEERRVCTDAAPIMQWAVGKHADVIRPWLKKKKAKVVFVCREDKC
jgi:hypothetical protein